MSSGLNKSLSFLNQSSDQERLLNFKNLILDQNPAKLKKPIFICLYPNNNYITIQQALRYCGDNSTHSKRALFKILIIWLFYGVYLLGFSSLIGNQSNFICRIGGANLDFKCNKEIACLLDRDYISL